MKKTIYSVDGYTEKTIEFEKIDLVGTEDIKALLKEITDDVVITAKRDVGVYATKAEKGQVVDNRMRFSIHGRAYVFKKQKYVVQDKDVNTESMVISYTDGQTRILKGEIFKNNYVIENKDWDMYKSIDTEKKYLTIKKNVYFKTPWGEIVYAPIGSKLCVELASSRDFYVVTNSLFKTAYTISSNQESLDDLDII